MDVHRQGQSSILNFQHTGAITWCAGGAPAGLSQNGARETGQCGMQGTVHGQRHLREKLLGQGHNAQIAAAETLLLQSVQFPTLYLSICQCSGKLELLRLAFNYVTLTVSNSLYSVT